jgi:hypothetical protein
VLSVLVYFLPAVPTAPTHSLSPALSLLAFIMRAATILLALTAALPSVFATIYTTSPVATTSWQAGQEQSIQWIDDPNNPTPSLKDFGPTKISIYVGNSQQQTSLQLLSPSTDVSTISELKFTPDASIGPNSKEYFIRFESLGFKDLKQPQYPALAFSAKFELTGMNGNFSPDVQQQINDASSLPIGPPTSTNSPASSSTSSTPPKSSGSPSSSSPRPSSTSGGAQGNTGGALGLAAGKLLTGVVAAVVGLSMFL